jgi:hypothetical protein
MIIAMKREEVQPLSARPADQADPREAGCVLVLENDEACWPLTREQAAELRERCASALGEGPGQGPERLLRDKDALRAALQRLANVELGVVVGLALSQLDDRGDTRLPELLRVLAGQVEEVVAEC